MDLESFSEVDLKKAGVYAYAEHPSTEVLVMCFRFNDKIIHTWRPGEPLPNRLVNHVMNMGEIRAHNAQFERVVLNGTAGKRIGFPKITIEQTVCTAAKAAAHGLPRALGDAAKALGTHAKDAAGRSTMLMLMKPRRGEVARYTRDNAPEKFAILDEYCADDVRAEVALDEAVPDLTDAEQQVYFLDQHINDRGIAVDMTAIDNAQYIVDRYKDELHKLCVKMTGLNPTQRDKLAVWIRNNGYAKLKDLQAETVKKIVRDPKVPDNVKTVLRIYSTYGNKAVSKLEAMRAAVSDDNRLHGMFLYHGAGPGRWSSLRVQLQNLFRPVISDPDMAIEAFASRDLEWVRDLYPGIDPMKVVASCIRGMLVPGEGKLLQAIDYAAIESRMAGWIFGEEWKLQAYRNYDAGKGPDLYVYGASRILRKPLDKVIKFERQSIGKTTELAFQYEVGVGALVTMAETYGVDLDEMADTAYQALTPEVLESAAWMWEHYAVLKSKTYGLSQRTYMVCEALKQLWRATNPRISAGWGTLKEAAAGAIRRPGQVFGLANQRVLFKVTGDWLYMRLPSGRRVAYYKPKWDGEKLSYMGIDTYTRHWTRTLMYGGSLCNNLVQGSSRDILVNGMLSLEKAGYPTVATVHDEIVSEVDDSMGSLEDAEKLMCVPPAWAVGLPLAVEGYRAERYRK